MKIRILDAASQDLIDGAIFYEKQEEGLGSYFIDSLFSDIDSLLIYSGIPSISVSTIACCQNVFLLLFTTRLPTRSCRFMPCLIAAAILHGPESVSPED